MEGILYCLNKLAADLITIMFKVEEKKVIFSFMDFTSLDSSSIYFPLIEYSVMKNKKNN
jgi:hypothetical protein